VLPGAFFGETEKDSHKWKVVDDYITNSNVCNFELPSYGCSPSTATTATEEQMQPDTELTAHFIRAWYWYAAGNPIWRIHQSKAVQRMWWLLNCIHHGSVAGMIGHITEFSK
jgi:hypothetical protein